MAYARTRKHFQIKNSHTTLPYEPVINLTVFIKGNEKGRREEGEKGTELGGTFRQ